MNSFAFSLDVAALIGIETSEIIAVWEGQKLTPKQATALSGIQTVCWLHEFEKLFQLLAEQAEIFYFNTNEHYRAKVETQTREDRFIKWAKAKFPNHPTAKSNFILQKLRSIKDPEEISQIKSSDSETAKSIDNAVQEINKATDFVKETLASGNIEDAINTLEFIEKSLGDVTNLVQPKITSDMTQIDTEAFGEDKMNEVLSITRAMNENKEENLSEMISNMSEIQNKGLNVKELDKIRYP